MEKSSNEKKMRRRPTFKQMRFAQEYVKNGGKGKKAALAVYDANPQSAEGIARQNLDKPIVQQEIKKLLDKAGLSLDSVSDKLRTAIDIGLNSGKASVDTALRGLDMALKLQNAYPATKSIKLSYSRKEQVVSKDIREVAENLKKLTASASDLLSDTE